MSSETNKPFQPSRDFFLSNPRSAEIRTICVGIVKNLHALLYPTDFEETHDRNFYYANIERLEAKLIELGIEKGMSANRPKHEYATNPVLAAEYVAGQILSLTGVEIVSEDEGFTAALNTDSVVLDQLDEGSLLLDSQKMPKKTVDFVVAQMEFFITKRMFSISNEEYLK